MKGNVVWKQQRGLRRSLLAAICLLTLAVPRTGSAESANSLYKKGEQAQARQQYEAAYQFFKQAYAQKPNDIGYRAAYERSRFYAAMVEVRRGQLLREEGKLDEALTQFQTALQMDPSLEIASQEIAATKELMQGGGAQPATTTKPKGEISQMVAEAAGPITLEPISQQPITLKLTQDSKMVYETIGKLAGVNVLFDPDYVSRTIRIELNNVSLQDALQIVALESRTFWRPVTKNTIFVAADNQQKRKELEEEVVKTFYLSNVSQPTDLQDIVNALRTILEIQRLQQLPSQNAIVVRGTPDQLAMAQKLIEDIDKPKPEVVVDVAVMQVARNKMRTLGIEPPTNVSVSLNSNLFNGNNSAGSAGSGGSGGSGSGGSGSGTSTGGSCVSGNCTFNTFKHLTSLSYSVAVPAATAQFLFSNSNSQIIQNPQIRALDGQKASLKIGDRIPVATGSFGIPSISTGVAGVGGFTGAVNTQFQYIDVGVNIEMTPTIHNDGDVTLKLSLEISSVTDHVNIGGIDQPVIGQRKIDHVIRLRDNEVNIMGGIFEDQEVKSWSGIPGLGQIPLFRYLFAQENKSDQQNEIVFVLIPHVVREQTISTLNNKAIDVGSGGDIQLRLNPQPVTASAAPASLTVPATQQPAQAPVPGAAVGSPVTMPVMPNMPQTLQPGAAQPGSQPASPTPPNAQPTQPQGAVPQAGVQQTPNSPTTPAEQAPSAPVVESAPQGAFLRFDPPAISQAAGSTASVNVEMQSQTPVSSVSMQLHYDPKLLQIVNVGNAGFLAHDGQPATVVHRDDGNGNLQISAIRPPSAPGVTGKGALFTLVFTLKAAGTTALAPVSLVAKDAKDVPIQATLAGQATVQIQPPAAH